MKIRYKIASCSSQSPSNPVINLISGTGNWQSARFCSYPQQITLVFYEPVIINSIKIIVHPHKVPQKINILYHLPTENNSDEFSKQGFIKFNPPKDGGSTKEQNNFDNKNFLRQVKVIKNLNLNALYLRLIIAQNYASKINLFNQIGISQIQIHGTGCETIFSRVQLKNYSFVLINNIGKQKMNLLTQFKQKCIEKQQYNEAQQIKQIINQINLILSQIKVLNQQKIKCVQQENYSGAKEIKLSITKLKDQIQHMADHFYNPQKKNINKFQIISNRKKILSIRTSQEDNNFGNEFIKNEENLKQKNEQNQRNHKVQQQQQQEKQEDENEEVNVREETNKLIQYEQQVVPALLNKINKSNFKYETQDVTQSRIQQNLPDQPEQLSPSNQANSSILTEFYQKLTIRKLHSKYWQFKSQALQQILNDGKKQANSLINKNKLRAFIFVFNLIMSRQNNKQLILSSLQLLNFISGLKTTQKDFKTQLSRQLQKSIILTLQKTQQNQNPKTKLQAQKTIIRMIQSEVYGCGLIYNAIVKNFDDKLSSKLKKVYIDTLQSAISNSKNVKNQVPLSIVNFAVKRLGDANNDVRKSSINLLKALKHQGYQDHIKISLFESKKYKQSVLKQLNLY